LLGGDDKAAPRRQRITFMNRLPAWVDRLVLRDREGTELCGYRIFDLIASCLAKRSK
jgi:hypothetical protein